MDTLYVKSFRELNIDQLYALLKARHDVFVVEQHCPYPDLDGRDQDSLHLFYADETGRVTAYMRMFPKADEPGTVRISRVLTVDRGTGLGGRLLQDGIRTARERLGAREIYVEAQSHAVGYYAREGFVLCSEEFLDDGIPHRQMRLKLVQPVVPSIF